ncbi:TonB-dependent siderophore receptor [Massilia niastensis]|uniref:TonB-dependent siderophore receptor n=1 Tax=Massilia niastensis TaxID=544911 RepID=UPI00039B7021|nr:TonB-dependent siderophore receptor [Massilia niastensis]
MYPSRYCTLALFLAATYPLIPATAADTPDKDLVAEAAAAASPEAPAGAPAAAPAPDLGAGAGAAGDGEMRKVRVNGQRQNYRALSATGATKTDTPIKDLPQSVRVLTGDLLKDVGVTDLAGALDLTSGISRQSNLGGLWDSYSMRGFTGDPNFGSDFMVNGFSSSRGYNGLRDGANTASVEVLKGPASALYGRGEPGGTVNITTKKPRFKPEYMVEASVGSHNLRRAAVDLTGPISETLAYRLNAAHEKADSFRDTLHTKRSFVSPSFIWLVGEATTVSYEVEASRQDTPFDRGVVAVNGVLGLIPNSRFLGEPGDGPTRVETLGHQVFVQTEFNENWKLQTGVAYRESSMKGASSEAVNLLADGATLRRQRRDRDFDATDRSGRIEILGKFDTGPVKHNILVGVDAYKFDDTRIQHRRTPTAGNPYTINIFNPVYGKTADPMIPSINTLENQKAKGVYAQDQIDLTEKWKAMLGVRRDTYDQTVTNRLINAVNDQDLSATSPRVGLVFQPNSKWSLYATAAKGFRPNSGISIDNQAFPAEESRSYEAGAKLETADGKISGTLAVYKIEKENVLATNPIDVNFYVSAGEVASKGVEVDIAGEIMKNVRFSIAYAYTDAKVTKGDNLIRTGSQFPNVPKNSASVVLTPMFKLGSGTASLGGAVIYVGERMGDVAASTNFRLPSYTTVRLISSYSPSKKLRFSLNVENLLDRQYYASSYSQVWVAPGADRSVVFNAQYKF